MYSLQTLMYPVIEGRYLVTQSLYEKNLTADSLNRYITQLSASGKSTNTIDKYTRELTTFLDFVASQSAVGADIVVRFRESLMQTNRADESIHSYVRRAYNFCRWLGLDAASPERLRRESGAREIGATGQLTTDDYQQLIQTGIRYGMEQTVMMLQVLVGTQMRYSDMANLTVEALRDGGVVEYKSQGENSRAKREHIPERLAKALLQYADRHDIISGMICHRLRSFRLSLLASLSRFCSGICPRY